MTTDAKYFLDKFLKNREIITEFYKRVPEDKLDYRMIDTTERKSDTPRESLAHLIDTTRDYINGIKNGEMKFNITYDDLSHPEKLTKKQLMDKLAQTEKELKSLLSDPKIFDKKLSVSWEKEPVSIMSILWDLGSHEILHQGWNLAIMDHLNIERFPQLKIMWG